MKAKSSLLKLFFTLNWTNLTANFIIFSQFFLRLNSFENLSTENYLSAYMRFKRK